VRGDQTDGALEGQPSTATLASARWRRGPASSDVSGRGRFTKHAAEARCPRGWRASLLSDVTGRGRFTMGVLPDRTFCACGRGPRNGGRPSGGRRVDCAEWQPAGRTQRLLRAKRQPPRYL